MADRLSFGGVPTGSVRTETPDGVNFINSGSCDVRNSLYNGPDPVPNLPGDYENVRKDPGRP